MTEDERRAAAAALYKAELTREWIDPVTITYPGADITDAYAIGRYVTEAKVADGRIVKGHKVGLTSKAMREMTGATEPDYGTLFDNFFLDEGSAVSMSTLNRPLVEVELVFVLAEDLGGPDVNALDVIRATDFIVPAFEVVDGRYGRSGADMGGVVDSIADAASCGFVMVGGNPVRLADVDIRQIGATLWKNGVVEDSGMASAVMGNPINAVAWLARKLHEFGVTMQAGHAVLSGSFIRANRIAPGEAWSAEFTGLGTISFSVVD
ncbi:MAG: fumarylacetoacetate hydrolase family protein [Actinomycetota bacterium]